MKVEPDLARLRFIECAQAMGYLFDTGRADSANAIQDDLQAWYSQLASTESARNVVVAQMLSTAASTWVKLYCAAMLQQADPVVARETFRELEQIDGPVAVLARAWHLAYLPDH